MVGKSLFEAVHGLPHVVGGGLVGCHLCLVDGGLHKAVFPDRTVSHTTIAVAASLCLLGVVEIASHDLSIMGRDDCPHIWHSPSAYLQGVLVKDLGHERFSSKVFLD